MTLDNKKIKKPHCTHKSACDKVSIYIRVCVCVCVDNYKGI